MGFFSELDIEVREMIAAGATRKQVEDSYPMLREDEVDMYFDDDHDGDYFGDNGSEEKDPSEYDYQYDDSMDGDNASALASAGYGTDEDYGYYGDEY
jgi:hypothetical protein